MSKPLNRKATKRGQNLGGVDEVRSVRRPARADSLYHVGRCGAYSMRRCIVDD